MFSNIFGVDFSGAKLAGRNTWVARLERSPRGQRPSYRLAELSRLEQLCGTAERRVALAHLVSLVRSSDEALWALDFPFGLPMEVMEQGARWPDQLKFIRAWGDADYGVGLECLRRAKELGSPMHIRRLTDTEQKRLSTHTITGSFIKPSTGCATCWGRYGGGGMQPYYRSSTGDSLRPSVFW